MTRHTKPFDWPSQWQLEKLVKNSDWNLIKSSSMDKQVLTKLLNQLLLLLFHPLVKSNPRALRPKPWVLGWKGMLVRAWIQCQGKQLNRDDQGFFSWEREQKHWGRALFLPNSNHLSERKKLDIAPIYYFIAFIDEDWKGHKLRKFDFALNSHDKGRGQKKKD